METLTIDPHAMQCLEVWGGNRSVETSTSLPGLDIWVFSRPVQGADAGGDVHFISSCLTGRVTRLMLADVCGHGDSVSDTAQQLRGLMAQHVNDLNHTHLVEKVNHRFANQQDTGVFATAIIGTFFEPTRTLTICNAGHPDPLHFTDGKGWACVQTDHSKVEGYVSLPLGVIDETAYPRSEVKLDLGDWVMCYTDALIESEAADGTLLGLEGLTKIVRAMPSPNEVDPALWIPQLLDRVNAQGGINDADDVTVLLMRATQQRPRKRDALTAPFRFAKSVGSALMRGEPVPWPRISSKNQSEPRSKTEPVSERS